MNSNDLEMVLTWRNHPSIRENMFSQQEISLSDHLAWFERSLNNPRTCLLIFEEKGVPQGFINFSSASCGTVAEWGFYAAPDAPKGTGQKLGRSAIDYAFTELELHKVCGQVLQNNSRSINFHKRLGFRCEGILRDQFFNGSRYYNVFCFGVLSGEWM